MKSFSIFPHKGYLNTDFQIKNFDNKSRTFYCDNVPINNVFSFRMLAGKHCIKGVDSNAEIEMDEVEVEDAIRLGGSKVEAGYCFENSPWVVAVMKDRTYFLNTNTGDQYVENGLSPLKITILKEDFFMFENGTKDDYGTPIVKEYLVFDIAQGKIIKRFDRYLTHNCDIAVFSDTPKDDGTCLHVMRYGDTSYHIDIPCKSYVITDEIIYFCVIDGSKYNIFKLQSDGTTVEVQYCSGPQDEFVGFVLNHYYIKRSGYCYYLNDVVKPSQVGNLINNRGGIIREINGIKTTSVNLVEEFYKMVESNKETCLLLDLHANIVDVLLYENSEGIYEKNTHYLYSLTKSGSCNKCPEITCELNKLGASEIITINYYNPIYATDDFIVVKESDKIQVIKDGKCVRVLSDTEVKVSPKGAFVYVKTKGDIKSVYRMGILSDELIIQGRENEINLSFVEICGIISENGKNYRIYHIDCKRWESMPHHNYRLMYKNDCCFLGDNDDDGQDYLLNDQKSSIALPVNTSNILSITPKGDFILSQSPRGIILHERCLENSSYRINQKLINVIDTSEYRNALFSDDGRHTIYQKNGSWYYYDISSEEEIEFEMDPVIAHRQRMGLYGMNFYTRFNDTDRRIDMVDPVSLQKIAPSFLSDYVFISPSGKLASKTQVAKVKLIYYLANKKINSIEVCFNKEVNSFLSNKEQFELERYSNHLELASSSSKKEDWEQEIITKLVKRVGEQETSNDRYYLYVIRHSIIEVFSTEKEEDVCQIELPENLGYLNSIVFSPNDRYVSICGKTIKYGNLQHGFVGVYDLSSSEWVYGPEMPNLAIWKSFFSFSGIYAYYNSKPNAMCGVIENGQLEEIEGRSILAFSKSGKYIAMSDKGYVSFEVNPSCWGHMKSANIYVRRVGNDRELFYSDHGDEIVGLYSKDVTCVSFSPDDKRLLSVSQDGVIIIRNLHLQELQEETDLTRPQRIGTNNLLQKYQEADDTSDWLDIEKKHYAKL